MEVYYNRQARAKEEIQIPIFKFLLLWFAVLATDLILYYGSQYLEGEPTVVGWKIDERIPFVPEWIFIYCSWYAMLFLVPLLLNYTAPAMCLRFLAAFLFDLVISVVAFMLWPTTFQRPEPKGGRLTLFAIRRVYGANHRFLNCAPSMHCSVALLFAVTMAVCPALPGALRIFIALLSLAVVPSTLFVKQHVLLDAVTAVPVTLVSWWLSGLLPTAEWAAKLM